MTDITDQDRRAARSWAKNWQGDQDDDTSAAARIILATVDAPEPTLSERLRYRAVLLDNGDPDGDTPRALRDLATDAAQMEHDLAEARAEVERLTAERFEKEVRDTIDTHYAAQKGAESNAESIDPADVKPGEAWIVECNEERRTAVKDNSIDIPWNTVNADGWCLCEDSEDITLVSRLVPAPRVITNPDELDQAKRRTVILSTDRQADVYQKDSNGEWLDVTGHGYPSQQVIRMENAVTVLWEPEA